MALKTKRDPISHKLSRTLPFTGLNVEACVLLGVMLLAAGATLRRAVPRGE